mmetsp:Transcript_22867/g.52278  ORF Transcript_22867/g.52278 Transcript_22867/m.52278 type:complete len:110 (-) Transcript_22867:1098-1427(-)
MLTQVYGLNIVCSNRSSFSVSMAPHVYRDLQHWISQDIPMKRTIESASVIKEYDAIRGCDTSIGCNRRHRHMSKDCLPRGVVQALQRCHDLHWFCHDLQRLCSYATILM